MGLAWCVLREIWVFPSKLSISTHGMTCGHQERASLVVGEAALDAGEWPGCIVQLSLAIFENGRDIY